MEKYPLFYFATLFLCISAYANNTENTTEYTTKAREYALNVVYEHIGEKRELNDSELIVVDKISKRYQEMQSKLTTKKPNLPTNTEHSFDEIMDDLFVIKGQFYEFFLDKNFGIINDK